MLRCVVVCHFSYVVTFTICFQLNIFYLTNLRPSGTSSVKLPVVFLAQVQAVLLCAVLASTSGGVHWLLLHLNQTELAGCGLLSVA